MRHLALSVCALVIAGCVSEGQPTTDEEQGTPEGGIEFPDARVFDIDSRTVDRTDAVVDCDPSPERCDGVDNNCNGQIDEPFGIDLPCTLSRGACRREGVIACGDDDEPTCVGEAGEPGEERCNDIDDDCDGATDEDLGKGEPCRHEVGACSVTGTYVCGDDGAVVCDADPIDPHDETCDGTDEDCDGEIDEDFGIGEGCANGVGACATTGTRICLPDGTAACDAVPGPPGVEACNTIDDDCDGETDEDFEVGTPCSAGIGACENQGQIVCTLDGDLVCNARAGQPVAELCNEIDDDCDGEIDEDYADELGEACVVGLGECRAEGVGICAPDGRPRGLHFEGVRRGVSEDEVLGGGFELCWSDTYGQAGQPVANILEACDGEVLMMACRPANQAELTVAAMGEREEMLTDLGDQNDAVHNHNGVDWYFSDAHSWGFAGEGTGVQRNSCDTAAARAEDRLCWHTGGGNLTGGYRCGAQTGLNNNNWQRLLYHRRGDLLGGEGVICSAEPAEPAEERCNGVDDDCDGQIDEDHGVGGPCMEDVGLCQYGVLVCSADGDRVCDARDREPTSEICNGVDDDCNEAVDDVEDLGAVCTVGRGACEREGALTCDGVGDIGALPFEGIVEDLPEADILAAGFERCYHGLYNDNPAIADILAACEGELLMTGCRAVGAHNLQLAAVGERAFVLADQGREPDPVNVHNGVNWYFSDEFSWGFGPQGEPLNRNSCDVGQTFQELRMCWHTSNGSLNGGYRCGRQTTFAPDYERMVYVSTGRLANGLACSAEPGRPVDETCNDIDDDCDGQTDEDTGRGEPCESGIGACARRGAMVCDDEGGVECDAVPGEPDDESCNGFDDDCDGEVDEGLDCPIYVSCLAAWDRGIRDSGVYQILDRVDEGVNNVWCDMDEDGGGWTLVASTAGATLDDRRSAYHDDLATLAPQDTNAGIWDGLAGLAPAFDLRFACRENRGPLDAPMTVDLSFYNVDWYEEFAAAETDEASCFNEDNGNNQDLPPPARRDNVTGDFLPVGDQWAAGYFEGEDFCGDEGDFTIDFDDRGMDSNEEDGTDWGEDDGARKCGANRNADGQWFIFARERRGFVEFDGRVAVVGLDDLANRLRRELVAADGLTYDDVDLPDRLTPAAYDVLVLARMTENWHAITPELRAAIDQYNRHGGHVITELGGISLLLDGLADDHVAAEGAAAPLGWFHGLVGAGGERGAGTLVTPIADDDPLFDGLEDGLRSEDGTERFFTVLEREASPSSLRTIATFPGDGSAAFPDGDLPAVLRGQRCGANVILANFDWGDAVTVDDDTTKFTINLLRAAVGEVPGDLADTCPRSGDRTPAPNLLLCGESARDPTRFVPEGVYLNVASGCAPDADTHALLVTEDGVDNLIPADLRAWIATGGIVLTARGSSHAAFEAVFGEGVEPGEAVGDCGHNAMPAVRANPDDQFWIDNVFAAPATTGCGFDLSGLPEIVHLGGWTADTVSLAYRDLERGRIWFIEADWPDEPVEGDDPFEGSSKALMTYMLLAGAHSNLHFEGVRESLSEVEVHEGGFEPCFSGEYDQSIDLAPVLAGCPGEVLMLACRPIGEPNFTVAAMGSRAEVLFDVGNVADAVHEHNGVAWYYSPRWSWGFAPLDQPVNRTSCDTAAREDPARLCWHTDGDRLMPGWRCGVQTDVGAGWERVVLQRNGSLR